MGDTLKLVFHMYFNVAYLKLQRRKTLFESLQYDKKAAGTDGIHLELINYGENKLLNRMYELVRQIWEEERMPEEWKETKRVPIHKRGDRDRCENYRRIAMGNAAYKIVKYNIGKN
jgi:hypothetical protein